MQNLKRTWLSCFIAMLLAGASWADARAADVFQQMGVGYGPGYAATNTGFASFGGWRGNQGCGCDGGAALSPGCCEFPAGCCDGVWDGYCQQRRCCGLGHHFGGCGRSACGRGGLVHGGCWQPGCGSCCTGCAPWPVAPVGCCRGRPFGGFFHKCCQPIFGNSDCGCTSNGSISGADGAIYDSSPSDTQPQPPAVPPTPAPENPIKATRSRST